jgi:hypothetical protein
VVYIYADRMVYRLDMAEEQIQELKNALHAEDRAAYPGLVSRIGSSIKVLRNDLTLLQQTLPLQAALVKLSFAVRPPALPLNEWLLICSIGPPE